MELWWGYLLLGLTAGLLGATLGVGAGIVTVPVLVIIFGFAQKSAQGMSLAAMSLMTLAAALRYMTNPEVRMNWPAIGLISLSAIVGAVLGAEIARYTPAPVLKRVFAIFLVVVAIRLAFFSGTPVPKEPPPLASASSSVHEEEPTP